METDLLRVMSFNIRGFSRRGDGINSWENRAALNVATIKRYAPDLIGLQEVQAESLATYREELPEYAHILGPGAGNEAPYEFNAIFFDPSRLEVLDSGGFWLSETPDRHSSAWRTRVVRCANWAKFGSPSTDLSLLHLDETLVALGEDLEDVTRALLHDSEDVFKEIKWHPLMEEVTH